MVFPPGCDLPGCAHHYPPGRNLAAEGCVCPAWFDGGGWHIIEINPACRAHPVAPGPAAPPVALKFSAYCPKVEGLGYDCMVCYGVPVPATGHVTVDGGPNDGRCLAIVCPHHAREDGYADVKERLAQWLVTGLLAEDLGPGPAGAPEVRHRDHWDPVHEHRHDGAGEEARHG